MDRALEWQDLFNLEWNNIMSNLAPNLDLYEMSRFLTQALEQIVTQLYEGLLGEGFESDETHRRALSNLLVLDTKSLSGTGTTVFNDFKEYEVTLASDIKAIVHERATITINTNPKEVEVIPVKYDEINRIVKNPFKRPSNNKVLRLDNSEGKVKLLNKNGNLTTYTYEYIRKPYPIILTNLTSYQLYINDKQISYGLSLTTPIDKVCELDSSLHKTIILQAVQLAAIAWRNNK